MTDQQLIKSTIDRLNITGKGLAQTIGITVSRMNGYTAGKCNIPIDVWRGILEYEARLHERRIDIADRAAALNAIARPRSIQATESGVVPEATGSRLMCRKHKAAKD